MSTVAGLGGAYRPSSNFAAPHQKTWDQTPVSLGADSADSLTTFGPSEFPSGCVYYRSGGGGREQRVKGVPSNCNPHYETY